MSCPVVYGATRNLYRDLVPAVTSCAVNGHPDEIIILAEDDAIPYRLPDMVRVINVADQQLIDRNGPNAGKRWTYMSMMRCTLAELLPEYDRAIWLDVDTIVHADLRPLMELDLTGYYYAAVKQPSDGREGAFSFVADYFNAGVLVCNLASLRDGMEDFLRFRLNKEEYEFLDQDVINRFCEGEILELPGRWNVCDYTVQDSHTFIRHYASIRDWRTLFEEARAYDLAEEVAAW